MNFIITILSGILCGAVLIRGQNPLNDALYKYMDECADETNANPEDIRSLISYKMDTKKAPCLMACIKKRTGEMNPNNTMNIGRTVEMLDNMKLTGDEKKLAEILIMNAEDCKKSEKVEPDECVAAKNFFDCIASKLKKDTDMLSQ